MLVVVHQIYAPVTAEAMVEIEAPAGSDIVRPLNPGMPVHQSHGSYRPSKRAVRHAGLTSGGCIGTQTTPHKRILVLT